ncbi:N-acetylneuraminate epimerase [bacterium HR33]|nr:N-acetylneuraminate epimerase [bacterium HR33]
MPAPAARFSLLVIAVFAACDGGSELSEVRDTPWQEVASLPRALWSFGAAAYHGRLYVIGGTTSDFAESRAAYRYDPAVDQWQQLRDLPEPVSGVKLVVVADTMFAVGGILGARSRRLLWAYNENSDQWMYRPEIPDGRTTQSVAAISDKIVVIAGEVQEASIHGPRIPGDSVLVYDVATGVWSYRDPMPEPRSDHSSYGVDGEIYVVGGSWVEGGAAVSRSKVEVYRPDTDSWRTLGSDTIPSLRPALVWWQGKLHALGGIRPLNAATTGWALSSHRALDLPAGIWTIFPPLPAPLADAQAVVLDGALYLIGGRVTQQIASAKVWVLK